MEPTKPATNPTCDHTYTTVGRKIFRCDAAPHPNRPDAHYFVRDTSLEDAAEQRRRTGRPHGLVVIPGERR